MEPVSNFNTRQELLNVIDNLPIAVIVMDKDRRVILTNEACNRLVNKQDITLEGRRGGEALQCIHRSDSSQGCGFGQSCIKCRLRLTVVETLEKRQPRHRVETTMVLTGMGERHLRISSIPLVLKEQEAALICIEDTTQALEHEQTRIEKEKLSAAIETAGAICHEMNQPLMVIMGMAEILLEALNSPESGDQRSWARQILDQTRRLGDITGKLMSLTEYRTRPYLQNKILDIDQSSLPPDQNP